MAPITVDKIPLKHLKESHAHIHDLLIYFATIMVFASLDTFSVATQTITLGSLQGTAHINSNTKPSQSKQASPFYNNYNWVSFKATYKLNKQIKISDFTIIPFGIFVTQPTWCDTMEVSRLIWALMCAFSFSLKTHRKKQLNKGGTYISVIRFFNVFLLTLVWS